MGSSLSGRLGRMESMVQATAFRLEESRSIARLWDGDYTLWKPRPAEIENRLGWLHCARRMKQEISDLTGFVRQVRKEGFTECVLIGMGGSSLAPEVCRRVFGVHEDFLELKILDTTHPDMVSEFSHSVRPGATLFLISSKSGGTVETLCLMNYFYNFLSESLGPEKAGGSFAAITDPGSGLEKTGRSLGFRKIFLNDPSIGGRYAALSHVGLVPAALIGMDLETFLERAEKASIEGTLRKIGGGPDANSAAWLGAAMGACSLSGRDKLTILAPASVEPFAVWVEQLIAESTGKEGKGILPVVGEYPLEPETYGKDRFFVCFTSGGDRAEGTAEALAAAGHPVVEIPIADSCDLGREFFRWELATSVAGMVLGINPFDQPDVESAKTGTKRALEKFRTDGILPEPEKVLSRDGIAVTADFEPDSVESALYEFVDSEISRDTAPPSYLAIQAYLSPSPAVDEGLQFVRRAIAEHFRIPVTVGYGPRFLHSTGQIHKGGPEGLFVQITSEPETDISIPDQAGERSSSVSFGILIRAQSMGDREALMTSGKKVLSFHLNGEVPLKLLTLAGAFRKQADADGIKR